jgi:hypothetical protein
MLNTFFVALRAVPKAAHPPSCLTAATAIFGDFCFEPTLVDGSRHTSRLSKPLPTMSVSAIVSATTLLTPPALRLLPLWLCILK